MPPTIEYCLGNVDRSTRCELRACTAANTVEKRCLQRCGTCYRSPFLVVDGEPRAGASHAVLLDDVSEGEDA